MHMQRLVASAAAAVAVACFVVRHSHRHPLELRVAQGGGQLRLSVLGRAVRMHLRAGPAAAAALRRHSHKLRVAQGAGQLRLSVLGKLPEIRIMIHRPGKVI